MANFAGTCTSDNKGLLLLLLLLLSYLQACTGTIQSCTIRQANYLSYRPFDVRPRVALCSWP